MSRTDQTPRSRRVAATAATLPPGATPPGTPGRILHAALVLFAQRGFHGTSTREIGAAAGINSATLYAHYPSKGDILRELVMIGHTELDQRLRAAVASARSARDRLVAIVTVDVACHAGYPLLAVVTNSELHALTEDAAAQALRIRAGLQALLVSILDDGIADGSFELDDATPAARAIADMVMRIGNWFPADGPDAEELADRYAGFALRIAGAR